MTADHGPLRRRSDEETILVETATIITNAWEQGLAVPAFNVPYLPMVEPVIRAVADEDSFALIEVARLEWIKFEARGLEEVYKQYTMHARADHVRLHLDHVPVIDEDHLEVDYLAVIGRALELGYQSVMVDGSRLSLEENIQATRRAVALAHRAGVACEAELGAVLGHESGPMPRYEELFRSGRGFTDRDEAVRFVRDTGCDWLSVAIGNIHGAVSGAAKNKKKTQARLNLAHLEALRNATGRPLVLHGGSGIPSEMIHEAAKRGIAKVNVGTEIRQVYEQGLQKNGQADEAREAVYERTRRLIRDHFGTAGIRARLIG
jgi:ketose-bisphosphate aldolase